MTALHLLDLVAAPAVTSRAASSALAYVRDRPRDHLVLTGSGGSGKTVLLQQVEAQLRREGRTVGRRHQLDLDDQDDVLLDDLHLVSDTALGRLGELAARGDLRLVVAGRPHSRPAVSALVDELARTGFVISLAPWTVDEVAALVAAGSLQGTNVPDPTRVAALTGGLPWLVAAYLHSLVADEPTRTSEAAEPAPCEQIVLTALAQLPAELCELVLALAAGYRLDAHPTPPPLAGAASGECRRLALDVTSCGLLAADGQLPPLLHKVLWAHVPHRLRLYQQSLIDDAVGAGLDLGPRALSLVDAGARDQRLVAQLEAWGDARLRQDAQDSVRHYEAAAALDPSQARLRLKRVSALVLAGRLDAAAAQLTDLLAHPELAQLRGWLRVAVPLNEMLARPHPAAEHARWAGPEGSRGAESAAAIALFGVGDRAAGEHVLARRDPPRPSDSDAMRLMADGVAASLGRSGQSATPLLAQAGSLLSTSHHDDLLPDSPDALGAIVAIQTGDLPLAESLLLAAAERRPVAGAAAARTDTLRCWVAMMAGRYVEARERLESIEQPTPRDEFWILALRLGLARRQDHVGELRQLWASARGELVRHQVDLYSLLPLGEVGLAGARLHDRALVIPVWDQASALLSRLDEPPTWSAPFHWYAVQACILMDRPDEMAPHAAALVAAAADSPHAATLATAGRAWLAVLAREAVPSEVEAAALGLGRVGQPWEGARLASHAAARSTSRSDAGRLMECARDLLGRPGSEATAPTPRRPSSIESQSGVIQLTERERQVVELVVAGRTYRQVGATLFLSAKTVEHHMARIRRRSGADSRSELLQRLHLTLEATAGSDLE